MANGNNKNDDAQRIPVSKDGTATLTTGDPLVTEKEIYDDTQNITIQLDGMYWELVKAMKPFQKKWDAGAVKAMRNAVHEGAASGCGEWAESIAALSVEIIAGSMAKAKGTKRFRFQNPKAPINSHQEDNHECLRQGKAFNVHTDSLNDKILEETPLSARRLFKIGGTADGFIVVHQSLADLFRVKGVDVVPILDDGVTYFG